MALLEIKKFTGGIAEGTREGYEENKESISYNDGIGLDFRTDPDVLSILSRLKLTSSTIITDFVKWQVEYQGYMFAFGDAGNLYRADTSNSYSLQRTVSGASGQGLAIFNTLNTDALWYAGDTKLGRATTLTGTMVFDDDYITTINQNIDQSDYLGTYANTYSIPAALTEGATNIKSFTPTKYMLQSIQVLIATKGTGNIVCTIHDSNNVSVGTVTVATSTLTNGQYGTFQFSTPLELTPGATYHIHFNVPSGTTTTLSTGTASDLSTVAYKTRVSPLVTDSLFHPMIEFGNLLCVGNGRFLNTLDDSEIYTPERLVFPKGTRVRCLEVIGTSLAIGTWRGSSISDYGRSYLYIWDGTSPTFNDIIPFDGQINALRNLGNNQLMIISGTEGGLTIFEGGITNKRKLKGVGRVGGGNIVEVYPDGLDTWEKVLYFGLGGGTSPVDRVIWSYGRKDNDYNNALTKDYVISTGNKGWNNNTSRGVVIGSIKGVSATKFLVSWKDNTSGSNTYGIDIIDNTKQQLSAFFETLRLDMGALNLEKNSKSIVLNTEPLQPGQSIEVYAKKNRSDYALVGKMSYDADKDCIYKSFSFNKNFIEVQLKVVMFSNQLYVAPTLLSLGINYEINQNDQLGTIQTPK